jgi:hypothetical protein
VARSAAAAALIDSAPAAKLPAAAPAAVAAPGQEGSRPRRSLGLGAAIALGIAVLLGAVWLLTHRPKPQATATGAQEAAAAPAPGGPATATAPGAPAAAGTPPPPRGALVVDALPWGEVIAIRNQRGAPQPVPKPATTPLVLSLPPGRYTLRLRNPAFTHSVAVETVVAAGPGAGPARAVAEFRAADADTFLKRMGFASSAAPAAAAGEQAARPSPPPELRAAARALFRADDEQVVRTLGGASFGERRAKVTAALLLGAARYALYVQGGAKDDRLRRQALDDARSCRRLSPALRPDPAFFSPGFRELYRTAG